MVPGEGDGLKWLRCARRPGCGPMTPSPSPSDWQRCRVALVLSAADRGCHFYFAPRGGILYLAPTV